MKLGMNIRNWGALGTRADLRACAEAADASELDSIWVNDHIGFPPKIENNEFGLADDFGVILDPLPVLAFLGACTERIAIGTAVLLIPYRPKLLTAKWIASIQELTANRLLLGVGTGWMEEEFRALGVDRRKRGRLTDEGLEFLHQSFSGDSVTLNGQELLLRPRPPAPPVYIGGAARPAHPRALRFGDGWMPVGIEPDDLRPQIESLAKAFGEAGREAPAIVAMKTLPLDDREAAVAYAQAFRDAGVTHLVHTQGFEDPADYARVVGILDREIRPAVA